MATRCRCRCPLFRPSRRSAWKNSRRRAPSRDPGSGSFLMRGGTPAVLFWLVSSGWQFDRLADFAPAIEAPAVGEAFALLRLHWLDGADIVALQEEAGTVFLFDQ